MEKIKGIECPKLGFKLEKLGDLLYEEGPILSHFTNDRNEDFLFSWVDENTKSHRWMLFKVSYQQLHQFFQQQLTLFDLTQSALDGIVHFININNNLDYNNITISTVQDIPRPYLPSKKSYYKISVFEDYAKNLKNYLELHFARYKKLYSSDTSVSISAAEPTIPYEVNKKKNS